MRAAEQRRDLLLPEALLTPRPSCPKSSTTWPLSRMLGVAAAGLVGLTVLSATLGKFGPHWDITLAASGVACILLLVAFMRRAFNRAAVARPGGGSAA